MNERAHSSCGASVWSVANAFGGASSATTNNKSARLSTVILSTRTAFALLSKRSFFMNKTYKLALTAMLTALSIVANALTIPITPNNAISFTILIAFIAGIYLGALPAVAVGFLGDLIGHIVFPMGGAYNWFVGLSCALTGLIPALVYRLKINRILKLAISLAIYLVVCSLFLNTFGFWLQYVVGVDPSPIGLWQFFAMDKGGIKKSFWVYLGARAPFILINWIVNGILVGIIQQTKILDKLLQKATANNPNGTQSND